METAYTINKIEDFDPIIENILNNNTYPFLLCLNGELGSGKTTFTKQLGKALGATQEINSPSFIIHNEYTIKTKNNTLIMHHLDLYRLESESELKELKLENLISQNSFIVIEWADKFENFITNFAQENNLKIITLEFDHIDLDTRSLKVF